MTNAVNKDGTCDHGQLLRAHCQACYNEAYRDGWYKPHFPVPAPMNNGNMAMFVTYYVAALDWSGGQCDDD